MDKTMWPRSLNNNITIVTLLSILFLTSCKVVNSINNKPKSIVFACNPKFSYANEMWSDNNINLLYDSLNNIDFTKQDFELRIWYYCAGQTGMINNVFIMRHFVRRDKWKAFYYQGFKADGTHKTIDEYFKSSELTRYTSSEWKTLWDSLEANNILSLEAPSPDVISKAIGAKVNISHDCYYTFELLQKDCKRSYQFSAALTGMTVTSNIPEYNSFRRIISLMRTKF